MASCRDLAATEMPQQAERDRLCPEITLFASALLEAAVQMPEGKQAVKMVNGEGKEMPCGK